MKRAGFLIEKIVETDNILHAFYKARKGKQLKKEVIAFSISTILNHVRYVQQHFMREYCITQ